MSYKKAYKRQLRKAKSLAIDVQNGKACIAGLNALIQQYEGKMVVLRARVFACELAKEDQQ
jgi:hypothetical protein